MKSKEEQNALGNEIETLRKILHELTDEEIEQVTGGGKEVCSTVFSESRPYNSVNSVCPEKRGLATGSSDYSLPATFFALTVAVTKVRFVK